MFFPADMNFQYFFFDTYPGFFLQVLPFALIAGLVYGVIKYGKRGDVPTSVKISSCAFVCYIAGLFCLTLLLDVIGEFWYRVLYHMPTGDAVSFFDFSGDYQIIPDLGKHTKGEFVGNILAFMPFGVLYPLANRRAKLGRTVLAGALCSLIIEVLQPAFGRSFDVMDLLLNTLGTFIAALIFFGISAVVGKRR